MAKAPASVSCRLKRPRWKRPCPNETSPSSEHALLFFGVRKYRNYLVKFQRVVKMLGLEVAVHMRDSRLTDQG